jgi:hypothetical protein
MAEEWMPRDEDDGADDGDAWSSTGDEGGDALDLPATTPDGPLAGAGFDWDGILFHEEFDPATKDEPIEHTVALGVLEPLLQHVLASLRREHRRLARVHADDVVECAIAQQLVARRMRTVADMLAWARSQRGGRCTIGLYPADAATMHDMHAARRLRETAGQTDFLAFLDEAIPGASPWSDDAQWAGDPEPDPDDDVEPRGDG